MTPGAVQCIMILLILYWACDKRERKLGGRREAQTHRFVLLRPRVAREVPEKSPITVLRPKVHLVDGERERRPPQPALHHS